MSRVSLNQRLQAIRDAAERIDPMATRIHNLDPVMRGAYERWCTHNERIIADANAKGGPGHAYAMMLDGTLQTEPMSKRMRDALQIELPASLTADMSDDDIADRYRAMVDGCVT